MKHKLFQILTHKCPNCGESNAFEMQKGFAKIAIPKMKSDCSNCGFRFHKEPGFYYGAMYVSYGLTVAQSIVIFIVAQQFFEPLFDPRIIGIIAISMMFLMRFNYKLSRMIWLNLFKNYQH